VLLPFPFSRWVSFLLVLSDWYLVEEITCTQERNHPRTQELKNSRIQEAAMQTSTRGFWFFLSA
jgi:hypothetical protein